MLFFVIYKEKSSNVSTVGSFMYDKFVRIYFKDGSVRTGLFNDEFYDDSSILVSCEVIKITDIDRMELLDKQI